MNIYKFRYVWHEGEEGEFLAITELSRDEFENLLDKLMNEINNMKENPKTEYNENGRNKEWFNIRCLPSAFEILQYQLEKRGVIVIPGGTDIITLYEMDDEYNPKSKSGFKYDFVIDRQDKKIERVRINKRL